MADEDVINRAIDDAAISLAFFSSCGNASIKTAVISQNVTRLQPSLFFFFFYQTAKTNVTISMTVLAIVCM